MYSVFHSIRKIEPFLPIVLLVEKKEIRNEKKREEKRIIMSYCYRVGEWKVIRKGWHVMACKLSFIVGNRRRVHYFLKDKWCRPTSLSFAYPTLYAIVVSIDALVKNVLDPRWGRRGVGPLSSQDLSVIGRWKRWTTSFCV